MRGRSKLSTFWAASSNDEAEAKHPSSSSMSSTSDEPRTTGTFDRTALARRALDPRHVTPQLEASGSLLLVHTAFEARYADEASLAAGDVVVGYRLLEGWWLGSSRSRVGIFPAAYVSAWTPPPVVEAMDSHASALWRRDPYSASAGGGGAAAESELAVDVRRRVAQLRRLDDDDDHHRHQAQPEAPPRAEPLQVLRDVAGWVEMSMVAPAWAAEASGDHAALAAAPSRDWMDSTAVALSDMGDWISTWSEYYGVRTRPTPAAAAATAAAAAAATAATSSSSSGASRPRRIIAESLEPLTSEELLAQGVHTKTAAEEAEIQSALTTHWMFSKLNEAVLGDIVQSAKLLVVEEGTSVITQGSSDSDLFYVIARGEVDVLVQSASDDAPVVVAQLGAGRTFGEAALLLAGTKRNATIVANRSVRMWTIERMTFKRLLGGHATADLDAMKRVLRQSRTLADLNDEQLSKLAAVVEQQSFKAGATVVKKGESGDSCFIIRDGTVIVSEIEGAPDIELGEGACFGEVALMSNAPRSATVSASEVGCTLLTLVRNDVEEVIGPLRPLLEKNLGLLVVGSVLQGTEHDGHQRELASNWLERSELEPKFVLQTAGTPCDALTVVISGSVEVSDASGSGEAKTVTVGGFFGAEALSGGFGPRAGAVPPLAESSVRGGAAGATVLRLSRRAFGIVVHGLPDDDAAATALLSAPAGGQPEETSRRQRRRRSSMKMVKPVGLMRELMLSDITGFDSLNMIRTLGVGSFGRVWLVEHKVTGKLFALKSLQKGFVVEMRQQKQVKTERKVMATVKSPFVVKLIASFQDETNLYLGMELTHGGELTTQLEKMTTLSEEATAFYGVGIAAGIAHLHAANFVYRDLKPPNVMIDRRGFPKLVDFGLSKMLVPGKLSFTLCGTPEYIAPEIAALTGHGHAVDWWAFGVLLFKCLLGTTPFTRTEYDEYGLQLYRTLQTAPVEIPLAEGHALDLLTKLLEKEPVRRLGNLRGGLDDILEHPFFLSRA